MPICSEGGMENVYSDHVQTVKASSAAQMCNTSLVSLLSVLALQTMTPSVMKN